MTDDKSPPRKRPAARARSRPRARAKAPASSVTSSTSTSGQQTEESAPQPASRPAARAGHRVAQARPAALGRTEAPVGRPQGGGTPSPQIGASSPDDAHEASGASGPEEGAIVVTGICGRMGRLLARKLHRESSVIGIDRRRFEGKPTDIVHHQTELKRRKAREIFRSGNIRAVVHLGTMHNLRESDRAHHSWNVVGFQKLLEYLSQYKVPKLVVLSSASLYGPSPDNPHFLSEDAPLLGAQNFSQIRDLVEVDMLAQSFFWKEPKIDTVILRPCHILGRTRNAPSNYLRMERPVTVMGFDPMLQVIHERDVIEAIQLALKPGVRGVFNLRGPGEMPLSRLLRIAGKEPTSVPGPLISSVIGRLWNYRAVSFPTPELDYLRYICTVDDRRARSELGFAPRFSLEETVRAVYSER